MTIRNKLYHHIATYPVANFHFTPANKAELKVLRQFDDEGIIKLIALDTGGLGICRL